MSGSEKDRERGREAKIRRKGVGGGRGRREGEVEEGITWFVSVETRL